MSACHLYDTWFRRIRKLLPDERSNFKYGRAEGAWRIDLPVYSPIPVYSLVIDHVLAPLGDMPRYAVMIDLGAIGKSRLLVDDRRAPPGRNS